MPQTSHYSELKSHYESRTNTPKPCERGDTVSVTQRSGIPNWAADYPLEGEVVKVEPRGVGTHHIIADWFVTVRFDANTHSGVSGASTELYCVGGTKRDWDEIPVKLTDTTSEDTHSDGSPDAQEAEN